MGKTAICFFSALPLKRVNALPCLCMTWRYPDPLWSLPSHLKNRHISIRQKLGFQASFLIAGHNEDLPLYTWYNWVQVENLCTVHLHLHGFLVQHSNVITKTHTKSPWLLITSRATGCYSHSCMPDEPTCKGCCISRYLPQNYFQHRTISPILQPKKRGRQKQGHEST